MIKIKKLLLKTYVCTMYIEAAVDTLIYMQGQPRVDILAQSL